MPSPSQRIKARRPSAFHRFLARYPRADWAADFEQGLYFAGGQAQAIGGVVGDARNTEIILPDVGGILRTVASGQPARTTNGLGSYVGSTNRVAYSEDFSADSAANLTRTANAGTAPDGTNTLTRIDTTATSGLIAAVGVSITGSACFCSWYVKRGNFDASTAHRFGLYDTTAATNRGYITINYATGLTSVVSGTVTAHGSEELPNGLYRIWANIPVVSGNDHNFYSGAVGSSGLPSGSQWYVWGRQAEAGQLTPYIRTTGSTASRADCAPLVVQGSGSIPFPGYAAGAQTGQIVATVPVAASKRVLKRWEKNSTDYIELYYSAAGLITLESVTSSTSRGTVAVPGKDDGAEHAITYRINTSTGELTLDVDGEGTEGAELFADQTAGINQGGSGSNGTYDDASNSLENDTVGANSTYPRFGFNLGLISGVTYAVSGLLTGDKSSVTLVRLATVGSSANLSYDSGTGIVSGSAVAASNQLEFACDGTSTFSIPISTLSVRATYTRTGLTLPSSLAEIDLGHGGGSNQLNGTIKQVALMSGDQFDIWRAA